MAFEHNQGCSSRGFSGATCEEWKTEIYEQYQQAVVLKKACCMEQSRYIEGILSNRKASEKDVLRMRRIQDNKLTK